MNLLFRVVYAAHCRGTHHKLALDGLRDLSGPDADRWRDLFLAHHSWLLAGSKEPDDSFKDFVNHVLHVEQDNWGGAPKAADTWYYNTMRSLQNGDWDHAARAAGILSHYVVDPIMPFHTGQSTAENNIHRAVEWSISKSYDELTALARVWSPPIIQLSGTEDWLRRLIIQSAQESHRHYQTLIDHYDFAAGVKNPPAGLDATCRDVVARLLHLAMNVWGVVLNRVLEDAHVRPPTVNVSLATILAGLDVPAKWITNKLADASDRAQVAAIFEELQSTGKVEQNLPEENRVIRRERPVTTAPPIVPKINQSPTIVPITNPTPLVPPAPRVSPPEKPRIRETPTAVPTKMEPTPVPVVKTERPAPVIEPVAPLSSKALSPRFYLTSDSDIVDAPSIGPKMAERLRDLGLRTVADLFELEPKEIADGLGLKHVTAETVRDWQDQARLMCQIPALRGHDAQMLVGSGHRELADVLSASIDTLAADIGAFLKTPMAERLLRKATPPEKSEIADWINAARQSQGRKAA